MSILEVNESIVGHRSSSALSLAGRRYLVVVFVVKACFSRPTLDAFVQVVVLLFAHAVPEPVDSCTIETPT
jgi:hypothetical protein